MSLQMEAVTGHPSTCWLSMQYSCHAHIHNKSDTLEKYYSDVSAKTRKVMYILRSVCVSKYTAAQLLIQLTSQTALIRISDTNSNNHTPEQCHGLYTDVEDMEYCMAERTGYRGYDNQGLGNYKLQSTTCDHADGCPRISPQFLPHRTAPFTKRKMHLQTVWRLLLNFVSCKQVFLLNHCKMTLLVSITSLLAMSFYCINGA